MAAGSLRSPAPFLLLLLLLSLAASAAESAASAADSAVMAEILAALKPSGWSSSQIYCKWKGVSCDSSSRVTVIDLSSSSLSGALPSDLSSLSQLQSLSLQSNSLSGAVPSFAGLASLQSIFLDGNNFTSITSGAFQCLTSLQTLSLSDNIDLSPWQIPAELSASTFLRTLLLNNNKLTGSIPESLTTLTQLQFLDVSNNNLTGLIPIFPASVKLTTTGNPLIGKTDTGGGGSGGSGMDSTVGGSPGLSNGSSHSGGVFAAVVVDVFIIVLLFVLYKFCYINRRHRKFNRDPEIGKEVPKNGAGNGVNGCGGFPIELHRQSREDSPVFEGGNVAFSIQVLRKATHNFSEENILGRGGFGVVYKGKLQDDTKIAVKKMKSGAMGMKGMDEFQAEIAVLTKVRHRHLVALLGYCIDGDERLLVYEYMPQGTLSQHLFERQEKGNATLTWKQRVTIALDVARGVEYLHSLAPQSYIHRDLKPLNILLGDDMRAKVADFGLVKNAPDGDKSMYTRWAGTFGYIAPEHADTGRVTTEVDVYAFGVVLMEIITGRKAVEETMEDERKHLVTWFRGVLEKKKDIPSAIDQTLDPDEETLKRIIKVAKLARRCTAQKPDQRPNMGHVVNILGPLVEQWKSISHDEEESSGINPPMSLPQALQKWEADEGTSSMFSKSSNMQSSIPPKPLTIPDSFSSTDCR